MPLADFVAANGQSLIRFAFLLCGGERAVAEDLVYGVLGRLTARGFGDLDDPISYVRRSIVNQHRSNGRSAASQRRLIGRLGAVETEPAPAPEDRLAIFGALSALSRRERAAIILRYYEDLPDAEIAAVLGCSRSTVRSLVHRALPRLRGQLVDTYRPQSTGSPSDQGARS